MLPGRQGVLITGEPDVRKSSIWVGFFTEVMSPKRARKEDEVSWVQATILTTICFAMTWGAFAHGYRRGVRDGCRKPRKGGDALGEYIIQMIDRRISQLQNEERLAKGDYELRRGEVSFLDVGTIDPDLETVLAQLKVLRQLRGQIDVKLKWSNPWGSNLKQKGG